MDHGRQNRDGFRKFMIIGPRYKICKRLGSSVFDKCQTQKFVLSEARRKQVSRTTRRRRRTPSDFGRQLLEKQKLRFTYGVTERQLSRYVSRVVSMRGVDSAKSLLEELESRLDSVVYNVGLANSRRFARQLVSHGHIAVNGSKVTIPSYQVKAKDKIAVRERSRTKTVFANLPERLKEHTTPAWVSFDPQKMEGEVKSQPGLEPTEVPFDLAAVLEFYSR